MASAHLLALKVERSANYNLGTGGGTSVKEIIDACREITGNPIPALGKPRLPGDPPRLFASSEKIRAELGWEPRYQDVRKIIQSAWDWHRQHPDGYKD